MPPPTSKPNPDFKKIVEEVATLLRLSSRAQRNLSDYLNKDIQLLKRELGDHRLTYFDTWSIEIVADKLRSLPHEELSEPSRVNLTHRVIFQVLIDRLVRPHHAERDLFLSHNPESISEEANWLRYLPISTFDWPDEKPRSAAKEKSTDTEQRAILAKVASILHSMTSELARSNNYAEEVLKRVEEQKPIATAQS